MLDAARGGFGGVGRTRWLSHLLFGAFLSMGKSVASIAGRQPEILPMSPELPDAVAPYFAAGDTGDHELAACFTDHVRIHDEGGEHLGTDAALAWRHATRRKYDFRAEPREVRQDGDSLTVRPQVTGSFPGSPIMLDHVFTLRDGRIAALSIG